MRSRCRCARGAGRNRFLFGDTNERRDLFERTFAFLAKYLK
jgi:hypothetical protein